MSFDGDVAGGTANFTFAANIDFSQFMTDLRNGVLPATPGAVPQNISPGGPSSAVTAPALTKLDPYALLAVITSSGQSGDPKYDLTKFSEQDWAAVTKAIFSGLDMPAGYAPGCSGCEFFASL